VLDHAVRSGEDQRFVTVVEADEVRRGSVGATHLDDLTLTLRRSDRAPPDVKNVTDFGSHQITSVSQGRSARQGVDTPQTLDGTTESCRM